MHPEHIILQGRCHECRRIVTVNLDLTSNVHLNNMYEVCPGSLHKSDPI